MDQSRHMLYLVVTEAAKFFGMGKISSLKQAATGSANSIFLVVAETGEYIIKNVLEQNQENTELELAYLDHLAASGFPVPLHIRGHSGDRIYCDEGCHMVAMRKADGEPPTGTIAWCSTIGELLGRLHRVPGENLPTRAHWNDKNYVPMMLKKLQDLSLPYIDQAFEAYRELCNFDLDATPRKLIHGDIIPDNILVKNERVRVVLDWEAVAVGPAIMDLAGAIDGFCWMNKKIETKRFRALISGYCRGLGEEPNLTSLTQAVQYKALTISLWALHKYGVEIPCDRRIESGGYYWTYGYDDLVLPEVNSLSI
ncbi:MAG: phosphotransferase [Gammaproteobacteria bacterium]|nr:phosphotransferase [Gammaproteobacteria bacterium]